LHFDRIYTLQDIAIFIFGRIGLKLPNHATFEGVFGDVIMDVKFKFEEEKKSGILMSFGVKIRPFPLTLHVDLTTVQC